MQCPTAVLYLQNVLAIVKIEDTEFQLVEIDTKLTTRGAVVGACLRKNFWF